MTDVLMNRGVRRVATALRLPVPLPRVLDRATGPWQRRELAGHTVAVAGFQDPVVADPIARMLAEAGAEVCANSCAAFAQAAEAFAVPTGHEPYSRLVLDATGIHSASQLVPLYQDLHELVPRITSSGRLVVLARPVGADPDAAAATSALEGFVRSAAKELGRRGATAQLVTIERGAEARAAAISRFLLSSRSAFVSAQPIHATNLTVTARPLDYVTALDRKVALVTGAARGIGEATARRLAEEGAHVVCVDRPADNAALAAVATSIRGSMLLADIRDPETPARLAGHFRQHHGGVDIIIHNAGITRDRTLARMSADEWDAVLVTNLVAVTRITQALLPDLRDDGRVICLSSVAGIAGNVGQTNYAASKAGLIGYTAALADQLAGRGITVNAVAPGFIETRMTAAIPLVIREAGRRLSALGQGGQCIDVAEVITFLAQPAAAGITGAALRVCGGALIGA